MTETINCSRNYWDAWFSKNEKAVLNMLFCEMAGVSKIHSYYRNLGKETVKLIKHFS